MNEKNIKNKIKERKLHWRTQDWFWVLAVLIYAQGFAFMYNNLLMQVISYVSTFVSIALAGIAIYISIKETTNNDNVKNEIYIALNEMRSKIGDLNTKMDLINQDDLQQINKQQVYEMKEPLVADLIQATEQIKEDKSNAEFLIKESLDKNFKELINNLNKEQNDYLKDNLSSTIIVVNPYRDAIETYDINEVFSLGDFCIKFRKMTNSFTPKNVIADKLNRFVEAGQLEVVGQNFKRIV